MAGFNKVILVGNMTRDVEIRTLPSGSVIGSFGIAINRRMRLSTGEEREEVCFVDCTAFDKKADVLRQYTHKGSLILVEGRLRLDTWTDRTTGQPRSKLNVVVEGLQLLEKRDPNAPQGGYQQAPGGWGQPQQAQGGWGQAPQAPGGWGQPQQPQGGWGQPQNAYQQAPGGWGQPQSSYQQPQGGWGQPQQPQSSWNQPAASNPPPAFQPPQPASFGGGSAMPPPPAFVPPADVKVDEAPASAPEAATETLPPPPPVDATTAESPNDDLPF